jgi:hypothetical protein
MLDELSPEQFDEWIAYRSIEPDPWDRLISIVKHGFALLCSAHSSEAVDPDVFDVLMEKKSEVLSPADSAKVVGQAYSQARRSA